MANTETREPLSSTQRRLLASNGGTESISTTYAVVIDTLDIELYDRTTIQFRNADGQAQTAQVWGSIYPSPGDVGTTTTPASSYRVQIGDDIAIGATSSALKSISTTGLRRLAVRLKTASGTPTLAVDQVLVHCQGTV